MKTFNLNFFFILNRLFKKSVNVYKNIPPHQKDEKKKKRKGIWKSNNKNWKNPFWLGFGGDLGGGVEAGTGAVGPPLYDAAIKDPG